MPEVTPRFKQAKPEKRRRAWNSTMPASNRGLKRNPRRHRSTNNNPLQTGVDHHMRSEVFRRANGRCQADGLHHPDCPGVLDPTKDWVPHHIWPTGLGGPDLEENMIAVWCPFGLGLNGCHGRVQNHPFQDEPVDGNWFNWRPSAAVPWPSFLPDRETVTPSV